MSLLNEKTTKEAIDGLFEVAHALKNGIISLQHIAFTLNPPRLQALAILQEYNTKGNLEGFAFRNHITADVLGKKVVLGPAVVNLSKAKPRGDPTEIQTRILASTDENVLLEIESVEPVEMRLEWIPAK